MKGVLMINLGSPQSTSVADVRRYLAEFLMDRRVIDVPAIARFCIVYGCILPFRPKHSAEAYRQVWTAEGSPLVATSRRVLDKVASRVETPMVLAMRYQEPSVPSALAKLRAQGVDELLVIPLFPHYAMASYESAVERVRDVAREDFPEMRLEVVPPFYAEPDYINALVANSRQHLDAGFDHLLFSFHGLPERQLRKSDPTGCHCLASADCCEKPSPAHATCYRAQCLATVREFARAAGLSASQYSVAFQSRLGRDPWLRPFTDVEIARLASEGVRKLLVISPAFVTDCLETLEELSIRGAETFHAAGGADFQFVPCLNEHPLWIDALVRMIEKFTGTGGPSAHS